MPEIREQFIESAVAGFGDNLEQKFAAKAWLADTVDGADDEDLKAAIDRWKRIDGKGRAWWRNERVLLIAWAALCALLLFPFFLMIRETKDIESLFMQKIIPGPARDEEQWVPAYAPGNAKAFLLTGEGLTAGQRSEALWRAEPGVPAYYAQYLVMNHTRGLPADFWAISSKLDPGNVWFDQYAAGVLATNAAARVKIPYSSMADKRSEWTIKDPARLEEAYGILKKSAGKTHYDSYSGARFRERFATFRSPRTMHEKLAQLVLLHDFGFQGERQTSGLGGLLSAQAWIYAEAGDTAGFSELLEVHSRVVEQRLAAQEVNYMQEMVTRALITATARDFSYAAEKLLFPEEAAKFARIADIDEASRKTPKHHTIDPVYVHGGMVASSLAGGGASKIEHPVPVSEIDLRPGRLLEHDQMSRSYSILAWTALGFSCLAAFLYRFRVPLLVRGVARRLAGLAAPIDWIWVLVGSVFLPIVCFVGLMLFSPLGSRAAEVDGMRKMLGMPGIMARFSILAALLLILPVLIGRWRFSRKMPLPLPAWKSSLHGWLSVGCLLLLLTISDYKRESWVALWKDRWYLSDEKWLDWLDWDWPRLFLVAVPALWCFVGISKSLFAPASGLLARVVVSGVMLKSYAVAMLCLVIVAGGFHLSQQYWFERDHFISTSLEEPEFPSYTHRVASQIRKETRELWEGR